MQKCALECKGLLTGRNCNIWQYFIVGRWYCHAPAFMPQALPTVAPEHQCGCAYSI
jgi:hypothetical protein